MHQNLTEVLPNFRIMFSAKPVPNTFTWVPPASGPTAGSILVMVGPRYMKRPANTGWLLPPPVAAVTSTTPGTGEAGTAAVQLLLSAQYTLGERRVPKYIAVPRVASNPAPVTVTPVPP